MIDRQAILGPNELFYLRRRCARARNYWENPPADHTEANLHKHRLAWLNLLDEIASAEAGRRVIIIVNELNQAVYDMLCASDLQRFGGYARFADELEAFESRTEADQERVLRNKRLAISSETYDMLNFIWDKKSDMLENGEKNLGKLLHGKKSEGPLIQLSEI